MCDYAPGELILAHDKDDQAAIQLIDRIVRDPTNLHVRIKARMSDVLDELAAQRAPRSRDLPDRLLLLEVRPGDEIFKIAYLYQLYARFLTAVYPGQSDPPFEPTRIAPNSRMTLSGVKPTDFAFSAEHQSHYMPMIGRGSPAKLGPTPVTVAIVDSGIEAASPTPLHVTACYDVRYPKQPVQDSDGHGTAIARIIDTVAPGVALHVYKVTDSTGLYEWDVLAGLIQATTANVINLSAEFGLTTNPCTRCGRITGTVRSVVFQQVMKSIAGLLTPPLVVVAAGNQGASDLAYPARYPEAIAVGAVDSVPVLHARSNHGTTSADGSPHDGVFMAPGGQQSTPPEVVGTMARSLGTTICHGTSFAAAYVSGLIALHLSNGQSPATTLQSLKQRADNTYASYASTHGKGIARL